MFPTTNWTELAEAAEAGPQSAALASLFGHYWYPIYCLIRLHGHGAEDASDLTQDYFLRLLDGRLLQAADASRGRFRALLKTDCQFFLRDMADRRKALKRGGGVRTMPLQQEGDQRFRHEPIDRLSAEQIFDRAWAMEIVRQALSRLAATESQAGRGRAFAVLRDTLVNGREGPTQAEIGEQLGMSVAAVDGAIRRLRNRYGEALRATVAETRPCGVPVMPHLTAAATSPRNLAVAVFCLADPSIAVKQWPP